MSFTSVAVLFALSTAVFLSFRNITLRIGLTKSDAIVGVFLSGVIAIPISVAATLLHGDFFISLNYNVFNVALLGAAGVIHYVLGRVFLYSSIKLIGASRATTILQAYVVVAALLSMAFLGELIELETGVGIALIIPGLMIMSGSGPTTEKSSTSGRTFRRGFHYALLAIVFWAMPPVFVRAAVVDLGSPLVGNVISNIFGLVAVIGYMIPSHGFEKIKKTDGRSMKILLFAAILTSFSQLTQYMALGFGNVAIVTPLTSTHILITMSVSYLFLQRLERVNPKVVLAGALVLVGLYLII